MRTSTGKPTVADLARWDAFQRIGCIACHQRGRYSVPEVHHLLSGNRRRGHRYTIRSVDSTYWISRAPIDGRCVYTAAYRPQNDRADGLHLGCHPDADRAKAACAAHAAGQLEAIA